MLDLTSWFLVFIRALSLFSVFPIFSMSNLPVMVRLALSALLAWLVAPVVPVSDAVVGDGSLWVLVGLILKEASVGLLLGFVGRLAFSAFDMVGGLITTEIGLSLPAGWNPMTGGQSTDLGTVFNYLGGVLFLALNLHHSLIVAFQRSFQVLPLGAAHLSTPMMNSVVGRMGYVFVIAVQMAAPMMAVSFVLTLVLAVLSRAVPTMNVFSESFGVRLLAGLSVLGMTVQLLAQHIVNALQRLPDDLLRVASWIGAR